MSLASVNSAGAINSSFGNAGFTQVLFDDNKDDECWGVAYNSRSKRIFMAGSANVQVGKVFAVACLNMNGILDDEFGLNGKTLYDFPGDVDICYGIDIAPDESLIAVGRVESGEVGIPDNMGIIKIVGN